MKAAKNDAHGKIDEAWLDLLAVSAILVSLGENAQTDDGVIPATWVLCLGNCVADILGRFDAPRGVRS